jgi:hypothetical protein
MPIANGADSPETLARRGFQRLPVIVMTAMLTAPASVSTLWCEEYQKPLLMYSGGQRDVGRTSMSLFGWRPVERRSVPTRAPSASLCAIFAVSFSVALPGTGRLARVQHSLRVVGELDGFFFCPPGRGDRTARVPPHHARQLPEPYLAGAEAPTRLEAVKRALAGDTSMQARLGRLEQIMRAKLEEPNPPCALPGR